MFHHGDGLTLGLKAGHDIVGWLAPGLVNIGTRVTHSQQGGFASIILLLAIGLVGLFFVKGGGREVAEAD